MIIKLLLDLRYLIDDETEKPIFPDVITFFAIPMLEKEWAKRMNERFAMTEDEKRTTEFEYNRDLVLALADRAPKGIHDFAVAEGENWKDKLREYFELEEVGSSSEAEMSPEIKEKIKTNEAKAFLAKTIVDDHYVKCQRYSFRS